MRGGSVGPVGKRVGVGVIVVGKCVASMSHANTKSEREEIFASFFFSLFILFRQKH